MIRRIFVAAAVVAALAPLFAVAPAHAAVGSFYYDNKDPSSTGCNNSAYTVDTVYLPSGSNARLLLRYSPACRTVWAHVIGAAVKVAGNNAGGSARIHRNWDNVGLDCVSPVGGTGCYTNMLYDGGTTSHAHGWNDTGVRIYSGTTVNY